MTETNGREIPIALYDRLSTKGPEDRRRAYRRYGARFEVDGEGELTLRLDLNLDGGIMNLTSTRL
jgi:hypothetical protein